MRPGGRARGAVHRRGGPERRGLGAPRDAGPGAAGAAAAQAAGALRGRGARHGARGLGGVTSEMYGDILRHMLVYRCIIVYLRIYTIYIYITHIYDII